MINIPFAGGFQPKTEGETDIAQTIADFIRTNDNAFCRELETGHVTASAFVVDLDHGSLLLMHHRKLDRWLQLGGHCDGVKDPLFVAQQEAYEESGLDRIVPISRDVFGVDIQTIPETAKVAAHLHYDVQYLFAANQASEFRANAAEAVNMQWVAFDEVRSYTDCSSILRACEKTLQMAAEEMKAPINRGFLPNGEASVLTSNTAA